MNVRDVNIADALFVYELAEATLTQYTGSAGKGCLAALRRSNMTLICEDEPNSDKQLGFVIVELMDQECFLYAIAALPEVQRRGVGRVLLKSCYSRILERSCGVPTPLSAYIAESNEGALALAHAMGFNIKTGARHLQYKATGIWSIPMVKIVAPEDIREEDCSRRK